MKKTNLLPLIVSIIMIGILVTSCKQEKCDCENQKIDVESIEGYFCYPAAESRPPVALNYKEIVNMLTKYDTTRIQPLKDALGYYDSRINTYDFNNFVHYLNYIKKKSKKAKIKISGISFIYAAKSNYNDTGKSYQDLIYIPTTTINGNQIPFDAVLSAERDSLVTFKAALAENGYKWIYDSKDDFENGRSQEKNHNFLSREKSQVSSNTVLDAEDSGAGNVAHLRPPY
ncbi:hypothetical protein [Tenacibaculum sp. IB213877]|uniref:hypothetical protein n=1 Tax=Tenacibaculum sp. IB213877 TaxID=3097351 RepID=UPI002A5AC459|nr:hypothetical protein [Tenacibaculum sp. IB213877]MDY0780943.1 hypothetical protein [Tenacibaculum sp. IB213877]